MNYITIGFFNKIVIVQISHELKEALNISLPSQSDSPQYLEAVEHQIYH